MEYIMEDTYVYIALGAFIVGITIGWLINQQRMQEIHEHVIDLALNIEDFIAEVKQLRFMIAEDRTNLIGELSNRCNNLDCKCKASNKTKSKPPNIIYQKPEPPF